MSQEYYSREWCDEAQKRLNNDEQHLAASGLNRVDALPCRFDILGHAVLLMRLDQVDEVMRRNGALFGRRLRRAEVHAAVQRHRIHRHDFRADPPSQLHANARFAGGGRTGQKPTIGGGSGHGSRGTIGFGD